MRCSKVLAGMVAAGTLMIPLHGNLRATGHADAPERPRIERDSMPGKESPEKMVAATVPEDIRGTTRLYIGAYGAGTMTLNSGMMPPEHLQHAVETIGPGYDMNIAGGISVIWIPDDSPGQTWSIIARILHDDRSSEYRVPARSLASFDQQGNYEVIPMVYWGSSEYTLITADILLSYRIGSSGLSLLAGPTFGHVISARRMDTYTMESAGFAAAQFVADRSDMRSGRTGIKGGAQYELPTNSRLRIIPTILYDMALNDIWGMDSWKVNALQLGFDIRFPIGGE